RHTDFAFERTNRSGQGLLGQMYTFRCGGNAALVANGDEMVELIKIHDHGRHPVSVRVSRYKVVRLAANFATIASTMTRRNGDIAAPSHSGWPPAGWRPDRLSCLTGLNTS